METPFQPFDPEGKAKQAPTRLRDVPFRMLVPNVITLLAICSGLTSIRMAYEGRMEVAVIAILFAAILDGLDGRVARFLKSSTGFGAQMDSLADFVNFGVAPAIVLYFWGLTPLNSLGWIAALLFTICACLRLARFNVMLEDKSTPKWHKNYFLGVPAPAGAMLVLTPLYLQFLGLEYHSYFAPIIALYLCMIGLLLVSNIRTFSGKDLGAKISRELALPLMIGAVVLIVVLFSYPWLVLAIISLGYLISIPFGQWRFNQKTKRDLEAAATAQEK